MTEQDTEILQSFIAGIINAIIRTPEAVNLWTGAMERGGVPCVIFPVSVQEVLNLKNEEERDLPVETIFLDLSKAPRAIQRRLQEEFREHVNPGGHPLLLQFQCGTLVVRTLRMTSVGHMGDA